MEMEKEVKILNLDDILPNRFQPRIQFNESAILELSDSIKEHGVIQPIVVRKIGDKYEIIAGERRYKASVLAGKTTIPAIVTTLNDKDSAEIALIENVQREDLTPIEEAISYKKILDMGYLNQVALAEKLGKTQSTIANKIRLLNLEEEVQEALLENKISERHARSLLKLDKKNQVYMLNRIINERLTVRKTDEEIKKLLEQESEDQGSEKILENNNFIDKKETIDEILDLNIKEEKGENKMFENMGIPTGNVVNPVSEPSKENKELSQNPWEIPVFPSQEPITVTPIENIEISNNTIANENVSTINPGFMDVKKIEKEAQDIFKPETQPVDIEMLLNPTQINNKEVAESPMAPTTPELVSESESSFTQTQPSGKFFNMFNFSEMSSPAQVEDLEKKEVNMNFDSPKVNDTFMFNFNPLVSETMPKEEPQSLNNTETFDNISAFNPMPLNEKIPSMVSEVKEEPQSLNNTETFDNISAFNPMSLNETVPSMVSEVKEESASSFTPSVEEVNNNQFNVQTENTFSPFNPYTLNDDEEFTQTSSNSYTPAFLSENNVSATVSQISTSVPAFNIREVVRVLRNCNDELKSLGYEVELDELDMENIYQATFRINKNG